MKTPGKPILLIYINNHFDPIWRRCWDRHFTFKGDTFISYADIECFYMLDNLELARQHPEYKFEAESSLVVQKFLERHPEKLDDLRQLAQAGRFGVTGGGQVIVDTNLILGESIIRNYLVGFLYVEDQLGQKTHLAVRNDGFGNSAQLPQILRGVEIKWATGMSYSPASGLYWRGLDGSTILHAELSSAAHSNGAIKYAPCPACRGTGYDRAGGPGGPCMACHGRGINPVLKAQVPDQVFSEAFLDDGPTVGVAAFKLSPEELLPNPELLAWAKSLAPVIEVRFALEEEAMPYLQPYLDVLDNPPEVSIHPGVELNPNNTGVYLTRILTKQNARRQEYAMAATELMAVMASLKGQPYPHRKLDAVWKTLLFTMFHDSITATHVDPAYREIQDMWKEIDAGLDALRAETLPVLVVPLGGRLSVLNPTGSVTSHPVRFKVPAMAGSAGLVDDRGQPVAFNISQARGSDVLEIEFIARDVLSFSSRVYSLAGAGSPELTPPVPLAASSIENQRFSIQADDHGLLSVWDKTLKMDVLKAGEYRPGELVLEHDEGSAWATLHPDQSRTPLAGFTHRVAIEKTPICQRLVFEIDSPFRAGYVADGLKAKLSVALWEGIDRVDFNLWVDWNTFNHRLRVAMPVPDTGKHFYGIPYGTLERQPYLPEFHWYAANGDWPAVNWAGVETHGFSLALLNKGLPSYRIEPGKDRGEVILLSVLRSPAIPTYLHEPNYYTMTEWDGMRDAGEHTFEFAVAAYPSVFADSRVVLDAESYNAGLVPLYGEIQPPELPELTSLNCRLAMVKWAEKDRAIVLRVVEFRGKGGEARLTLPDGVQAVDQINLLEREARPLVVENSAVVLSLRPWEIASLRLMLK
ncbi:MAG TPA: glycosyl hydrolase-related protein [Anaerolineaceae bacterium]